MNNMNNKKLLRNLYLMAKYHATENRMRSNQLDRDDYIRNKDVGLADAYEAITFFLLRPEILENMDYNKIMKVKNPIPNWLK